MSLPVTKQRFSRATSLERYEAAQRIFLVIDRIEKGKVKRPPALAAPDDDSMRLFIRLETALSADLKNNWRQTYTDALTEIFNMLPQSLTKEATALLEEEILSALGPAFGMSPKVRELMKSYIADAYKVAKQQWKIGDIKDDKSSALALKDHRAIDVLTRHNCFWLGEHYGEHIGPEISKLTQKALEDGLGRKALAEELKENLRKQLGADYKYWDVASSAALVRARSFGAISGMEEAGITEYEILAMGDERMCEICGELNGRVFSVSDARSVIDSSLALTNPTAFKKAMPWFSSPPIGKSSSSLAKSGQSMPPFHGRCRCVLIVQSVTEPVTKKSFPRVDAQDVQSFDTDTRIMVFKSTNGRSPAVGLPHWKYDIILSDGTFETRRFFDGDGKAAFDVDFTQHHDPNAHPYAPHVHDWKDGKRPKKFRKPRKWETEMARELHKEIIKDNDETDFTVLGDGSRYWDVNDFLRDLDIGAEIEFEYDGHGYTVIDDDLPHACEWDKEETWKEFKDVQDMMDNFKVHTGESLREIVTKVRIVFSVDGRP